MEIYKKKITASIVSFCFFYSTISQGATIEEIEARTQEAIENYRKQTKAVLKTQDNVAKAHVRHAIANSISLSQIDLNNMSSYIEIVTNLINQKIPTLDAIGVSMEEIAEEALTLENYGKFLKEKREYDLEIDDIQNYLSKMSAVKNEMDKYEIFLENICDDNIPLLDVPVLSLPPAPTNVNIPYDRITSVFQNDPYSLAYFNGTASVGVIAAFAYHVAVYGLSATIALFEIQATSSGAQIVGTGTAAVVLLVVIAAAFIVAEIASQKENAERKKRAERAMNNMINQISIIQQEFNDKRLKQNEFQDLAMIICTDSKAEGGKLFKLRQAYNNLQTNVMHQITATERLRNQLLENRLNSNKLAGSMLLQIKTLFTEEIIEQYNESLFSSENLNQAAKIYNEEFLLLVNEYSQSFIENRSDCFTLSDLWYLFQNEVFVYENWMESYKDSNNSNQGIFKDLNTRIINIKSNFEKRLNRCESRYYAVGDVLYAL